MSTTTLYVGNLSFYSTEEQIYELFSKVGQVKRIIMGLDRLQKTPCGFCFVEFFERQSTNDCKRYLDGTKLDERFLRVDLDPGFKDGRQFGRGKSGGQIRDEFRTEFDPGRGGWGKGSRDAPDDHGKRRKFENRNPRFREERSDEDSDQ